MDNIKELKNLAILDVHNNCIDDLDATELPNGLIDLNMRGNPLSIRLEKEEPGVGDGYVRYKIIDKIKDNCPKLIRFNSKIVGNISFVNKTHRFGQSRYKQRNLG